MSKLQIYKASAGSGKTYLLTLNYLKTAFKAPDRFTKILAVTFTNKAAEEMKTRILEKLDELIKKGKNADYFKEIKQSGQYKTDNELIKNAETIRDNILHDYSAFNVGTIDSFVQKVIRAFAFEMNLNSSYEIEFDTDKVTEDLTNKLYEKISFDRDLQKWLLQYAQNKTENNKNWDFKNEIKNLTSEIFKEQFLELYKNRKIEKKEMNDFLKTLYKIKNNFESKMSELAAKYKKILEDAAMNPGTYGMKFKIISNHFLVKTAIKKEYDNFTATFIKARDGIENWYAKSASAQIINDIKNTYEKLYPLIETYFKYFEAESENYYTAMEIIKQFHAFGIINDMAAELSEYRSENNILLISDTNLLLKEIIGNNDAPFIYEKTGTGFYNIFIDEFQDTSNFQWANFKPLITNSLSQGYTNLIVGDIKQSVYRWRGGDWKLLLQGVKQDIGKEFSEEKTLDTNWRSKENIIKFNNTVFNLLPEIIQNSYNEKLLAVNNEQLLKKLEKEGYKTIITDAYAGQAQKIPDKIEKKGGTVKIKFLEPDNYNEQLFCELPETINKLIKIQDKRPKDIGILVRTNKQAKEITELLTEYQNQSPDNAKYKIVSSDSLYIENSSAVRLLISAMKYTDNRNNTVNNAQLIYEYQNINNKNTDLNKIFTAAGDSKKHKEFLPEKFLAELNNLAETELFDLSEKLINIFNLTDKKEEFAYLQAFQNTISEFSEKKYSGLNEFLEYWEEKGKQTALKISDKTDAVNILTIHKSKGLAFDTVIIPYTNFNLNHKGNNSPILWSKPDKAPFNTIDLLPVKYSSNLAKTIFRTDYFNEMLYSHTDALNLIYVAFTRAEETLIIFAPEYKKQKKEKTIPDTGKALFYAVTQKNTAERERGINLNEYYNPDTKTFEISDNSAIQKNKKIQPEDKYIYPENKYPNNNWHKKLSIKLSSEDFFIESIEKIEEKVNYGTLMHGIFQEIITEKDIDKAVDKKYIDGLLNSEEKQTVKQKIKNALSDEKVKSWFDGTCKVLNEDALLTEKGNIKIPDRVMICDNKLIVIDFKFGKHRKKYITQISEYKQLLENLYDMPAEAFLFYPEENKIIEV